MGIRMKRKIALALTLCLTAGLLPENQIRQVRAAGQTKTTPARTNADKEETQDGLRGVAEETAAIQFSKESGTYSEAFTLDLTCVDADAVIYYTTDGSDPSDASNEARKAYTQGSIEVTDRTGDPNVLSAIDPILYDAANVAISNDGKSYVSTLDELPADEDVDKCTVIKAAAQYADGTCSEVVTNTYFIGDMADHIEGIRKSCEAAGMDLSVMSISMDADDLFDYEKGIYVKGSVFDKALEEYLAKNGTLDNTERGRKLSANYNQKGKEWERKTHIDYFESNGTKTTCKLQQDCGIRIQGNYSRSDYQKSFRLIARTDYGKKNFKYGFWDNALDSNGNVIEKYKKIVLRNGGNCAFTTKFSDAYWQSLMKDIACETQSARPCVVYLNGEYWGVYILQNDYCSDYFEDKYGLDKDSILVYKGDAEANTTLGYKLDEGELPEGVTNDNYYFQELEAFMSEHDNLSSEEDYEAFCKLVDKDSALDYFAMQVWINNKWDWPGKNWSMWKSTLQDADNPYADGKWRFMIYDVEFGGISGYSDISGNTIKDSKLLQTGTAEKSKTNPNWDKPNARCFALFMTNAKFREEFKARLTGFSDTMFEKQQALAVAEKFKNVYQPILDQFFNRFPTKWNGAKKTAEMAIHGNGWDTYGTWANIVEFVGDRAGYISKITQWVDKQYPSTSPAPTASAKPSASPTAPPKATATPPANSDTLLNIPLCDGAVKIVKTDAKGKVLSTQYKVEGITYTLASKDTFIFSKDNNEALQKKKSYVIPDVVVAGGNRYKVAEVEAGVFQGAKKLKSVTIGENVKKIGKNAFKGCKKLKTITFIGKKLKTIQKNAFQGIPKKAKIVCPKSKKKAYKKLIAKSGVKLKTAKLKVAQLPQKNSKKTSGKQTADTGSRKEIINAFASATKKAETTVTMSSLVQEDGSFKNAKNGTVVTISSAAELKLLSEYTKADKKTSNITFRQTEDIDGDGMVMEPIGVCYCKKVVYDEDEEDIDYEEHDFGGTYDGGGYSVRNLTIGIKKSDANEYYMGMFGLVWYGELLNINLESIRFVDADTGESFITTENMEVHVGGIVSQITQEGSVVEGCSNYADISINSRFGYLAGIAGYSYETAFRGCHNYGNLEAKGEYSEASGITGTAWREVSGCTNQGDITGARAAGIVCDKYSDGDIKDCENSGSITGKAQAAGIVCSYYSPYSSVPFVLAGCVNSGEVQAEKAAGICMTLLGVIQDCENRGTIRGSDYAGGIAGMMLSWRGEVLAVCNRGEVIGENLAGGIVAYVVGRTVANAQNFGKVSADKAAGGIAGYAENAKLGNLWNHGAVSGSAHVGGIVGSSDEKISLSDEDDEDEDWEYTEDSAANTFGNCIHLGTLSNGTSMGAMIGYSSLPDKMFDCYYLEGSASQVNGLDAAVTAKTIQTDAWKQQTFLDELNNNIAGLPSMMLLAMQYDSDGNLQWKPQFVLDTELESVMGGKIEFFVKNNTTGETFSLNSHAGQYVFSPEMGVEYSIYRVMADGTQKVVNENVCLQAGASIFVQKVTFYPVNFWLDAETQEDEDFGIQYVGKNLYTALYYQEPQELTAMPEAPVKEGYEFVGWYSSGYAVSEKAYEEGREHNIKEYQERQTQLAKWWKEDYEYLEDDYDSEEDYIKSHLKEEYGYETVEEYTAHYDEAFEARYRVTELYEKYEWDDYYDYNDGDEYYVPANDLFARWKKKDTQVVTPPPTDNPPQGTIDPWKYKDKEGKYVQKKGLIYKVNRKKKTATVVGVTSKSLAKATIVKTVKTGGKSYKVNAISKKAFKGCYKLKKIIAKGKSLKKVKKKALKLIRK